MARLRDENRELAESCQELRASAEMPVDGGEMQAVEEECRGLRGDVARLREENRELAEANEQLRVAGERAADEREVLQARGDADGVHVLHEHVGKLFAGQAMEMVYSRLSRFAAPCSVVQVTEDGQTGEHVPADVSDHGAEYQQLVDKLEAAPSVPEWAGTCSKVLETLLTDVGSVLDAATSQYVHNSSAAQEDEG